MQVGRFPLASARHEAWPTGTCARMLQRPSRWAKYMGRLQGKYLCNEDDGCGLIQCSSVHVDSRPQWEHKADDAV